MGEEHNVLHNNLLVLSNNIYLAARQELKR